MSWLSGLFKSGSRDPSIIQKENVDPLQRAVATPLSSFLASEIGQGIEGEPKIDPNAVNRYNEFIGLNANDLFDKYIAGPQTEAFKRDFLPIIQEGYAGALRGSGRYRSEEDNINRFSQDLAGLRYQANKELPLQQWNMAVKKQEIEYNNWWDSRAENNPALKLALDFLKGASTGTTVTSFLDPGQKGWFGDVLNAGATVAAASIAACWVASEIYSGWDIYETVMARQYVTYEAPTWFRNFYIKYGQSIAKFIHDKPVFKWMLKPLFDWFVKKGEQRWNS